MKNKLIISKFRKGVVGAEPTFLYIYLPFTTVFFLPTYGYVGIFHVGNEWQLIFISVIRWENLIRVLFTQSDSAFSDIFFIDF